jgi:D-3-phosphoglycerate dehydrogenase
MHRVLIIEPIHPAGMALLQKRADIRFDVVSGRDAPGFLDRLAEADAATVRMMPFAADLVAAAKKLKVLARHGVGYDTVDVAALTAAGIPLAILGEVNAVPVAEQVLCFMLALARRVGEFDRATRSGDFAIRHRGLTFELAGKTLLLVGFGRIGREVARRAQAFAMRVVAYDPFVPAREIASAGCAPVSDWRNALSDADFVSLHAPLTAETRGMIGAQEIACMKSGAFLINTARGGLLDSAALAAALREERIAGAAIDVYPEHPPRADEPLLKLDSVLLSPHSSGMTRECTERMAIACAENVLAGLDGTLDPARVVNREVFKVIS